MGLSAPRFSHLPTTYHRGFRGGSPLGVLPNVIGAQVPSRRSGLTFNPEFRSRSPSSITRAKPRRVVRSAVLGATARRRLGEVSPGRSADLVRTPQLLPGTPLGGDPCEYFSGGLAVQPRVGARALNRANFSREQFVGRGGETGKGGRGTSYVYGGWERAVAEVELINF